MHFSITCIKNEFGRPIRSWVSTILINTSLDYFDIMNQAELTEKIYPGKYIWLKIARLKKARRKNTFIDVESFAVTISPNGQRINGFHFSILNKLKLAVFKHLQVKVSVPGIIFRDDGIWINRRVADKILKW